MTITVHDIIPESRKGANDKGVKSYSHTIRVTTDTSTDSVWQIGSAITEKIGDQHPDDSNAYLTKISPRCTDGYTGWEVDIEYNTERRLANDPTNDEVLVAFNSEIYQVPLYTDAVSGELICNSAGDPFIDPMLTRDECDLVATITGNSATIPTWFLDQQNTVNNATISIGDAYSSLSCLADQVKFQRAKTGSVQIRDNTRFYSYSFDLYIKLSKWTAYPLDAGFRELDYSGDLIQIRNAGDGEEVTAPAPLDGLGSALDNPSPANNVVRTVYKYPRGDLTVLPGVS